MTPVYAVYKLTSYIIKSMLKTNAWRKINHGNINQEKVGVVVLISHSTV